MDSAEKRGLKKLVVSLQEFCAYCLKISDKQGKSRQFLWNAAQLHIHAMLEQQREETGKVRAIILNGGALLPPDNDGIRAASIHRWT